jgi:hypothetical protein
MSISCKNQEKYTAFVPSAFYLIGRCANTDHEICWKCMRGDVLVAEASCFGYDDNDVTQKSLHRLAARTPAHLNKAFNKSRFKN